MIHDSAVFGVKKLQEKRLEFEKQSVNAFSDAMINEETTALSATLTRAFTYLRLIVRLFYNNLQIFFLNLSELT